MSGSEDSDIENDANFAILTLLPDKSKQVYEFAYKRFKTWCDSKNVKTVVEKVLLAYFANKAKVYKPSTLWSTYSMLRTTISMKNNVDISKFTNLIAFLKRQAEGYRPKKSKVLTKEDFNNFLLNADNQIYLALKVVLIIGLSGGCRKDELVKMLTDHVVDFGSFFKICIPDTKTKHPRTFTITEGNIDGLNLVEIVRKYVSLRPNQANSRFFLGYRNGKCTRQPIGINTIGTMPKKIAIFLNLPNSDQYTGHCFRRSSASLLANSGADLLTLKRHGGWKSSTVAEGYIEDSIENKKRISTKILGENVKTNNNTSMQPANSRRISPSPLISAMENNETNITNTSMPPANSRRISPSPSISALENNHGNMKFVNCVVNIYN